MAPADAAYRQALVAVVEAWEAGSPVVGSDPARRAEIARRALRRWNSAPRRGMAADRRVADLARGLIEAFEPDLALVGPLARDYEYLAARIATAFEGPV